MVMILSIFNKVACGDDLRYVSAQEVRVRFAGYGKADDEWVNLKTDVRERSIPLEPLECHRVQNGDLVLCFRVYPQVFCPLHI